MSVTVAAHLRNDHEFQQLTDPYRRELLVHCYRILGTFEDAEDALQETLFRAWRRLDSLKVQTSLRAWLYKISTHVCLDMLDNHKVRSMPHLVHIPADPDVPLPAPDKDPIWLGPLPDSYLDGYAANPEAHYEAVESVRLAFLTVLQHLPGRQRVILILRDVLGWSAQEVADLLDVSVPAANSALQRARTTLNNQRPEISTNVATISNNDRLTSLLTRYVQAWEAEDSIELIALLREDATLTMPPIPAWYKGQAPIKAFLERHIFVDAEAGRLRLVSTRANGCPAFAVYQRDPAGIYRPAAVHVLTIVSDRIAQIDDFLAFDQRLFAHFDLPLSIDR